MIPTLKQRYEKKKDENSLSEALDTEELRRMRELLDTFDEIVGDFALPELKKGIKKAADDMTRAVSGGVFSRLAAKARGSDEVRVDPSKLAKVASFQTGLVKGLQQLPDILDIIARLENAPKNDSEALKKEVDDLQTEAGDYDDDEMKEILRQAGIATKKPKPKDPPKPGTRMNLKGSPGSKAPPIKIPGADTPAHAAPAPKVEPEIDLPSEPEGDVSPPEPTPVKSEPKALPVGKGPNRDWTTAAKKATIGSALSTKQRDRLRGIMLNAFAPPGFLAMFRGMPYVNDNNVVDEILNLTIMDAALLMKKVQGMELKVPAEQSDLRAIAKAVRTQTPSGEVPASIKVSSVPEEPKVEPKAQSDAPGTAGVPDNRTIDVERFMEMLVKDAKLDLKAANRVVTLIQRKKLMNLTKAVPA